MGKSTRQVQQMLAEVDPEAAAPAERLRALGDGRWELKAVIDAERQRGLQKLRELLSHVDPHLTFGQLVGRLVREGVARYDPSRPPRRKRRKSDPAADECTAETAGRETAGQVAAAAEDPRPGREVRGADEVSVRVEAVREADGSRHFADWSCQQEEALGKLRPGSASGRSRAAVLRRRSALRRGPSAPGAAPMRWRQSRLRRRRPVCSRQFDCGSELPRRRIGGADFGGEAWRGRRRGIDRADCGGAARKIVRQIDSGCGQAGGLAARFRLLQLRRPAYRGGAAARAFSWRSTTSCRSRAAALRRRVTSAFAARLITVTGTVAGGAPRRETR